MKKIRTNLIILIATVTLAILTNWYIFACVAVILASIMLLINSITTLLAKGINHG